jgi:hypothetical protein
VRNVIKAFSPDGPVPPPKAFQHLIRKKGVIVFVEFRKGLLSLWFAVPARYGAGEADLAAARLNLSGFLMEQAR